MLSLFNALVLSSLGKGNENDRSSSSLIVRTTPLRCRLVRMAPTFWEWTLPARRRSVGFPQKVFLRVCVCVWTWGGGVHHLIYIFRFYFRRTHTYLYYGKNGGGGGLFPPRVRRSFVSWFPCRYRTSEFCEKGCATKELREMKSFVVLIAWSVRIHLTACLNDQILQTTLWDLNNYFCNIYSKLLKSFKSNYFHPKTTPRVSHAPNANTHSSRLEELLSTHHPPFSHPPQIEEKRIDI